MFTSQAGESGIEVRIEGETVWLTQKLIGTLFDVDVRTVSEHLQNIFAGGELSEESVIRKFRITAADGKKLHHRQRAEGARPLRDHVSRLRRGPGRARHPDDEADWAKKLDAFLQFNQRDLLDHPGKVTAEIAKAFAESEFEKYRIVQDRHFESDFDRMIKQLPKDGGQP